MNDSLLTLFVALTGLAVVAQAGILISLYVLARRAEGQLELTLGPLRELTPSLKTVTENMKTASADCVEIGRAAREQFHRVEDMVGETQKTLQDQLQKVDRVSREVADRMNETVGVVQDSIIRPVREVGALAHGLSEGFATLFGRRDRHASDPSRHDEELFI